MDGKEEGWAPIGQPISLFVNDLSGDLHASLVRGLEDRGLYYEVFDIKRDPVATVVPALPRVPNVVVAAGRDAFKSARLGLKQDNTIIYTVPEVEIFLEDKRLAKHVAEYLLFVQTSVFHREGQIPPAHPESSSTSPSIPTTSQTSTPTKGEFIPSDSGISLPTEGLTKDELYELFESRFSEDPFVFWTGNQEVAIYLDEPEGRLPIEFSLEEFFTILKLTELTKAKVIIWREPDASS